MPRRLRVELEGGLYHVYNKVGHEERPFADDEEVERFLDLVRDTKKRDGFVVYAWCVMPNHFHLALRTRSVPLSRSMRSILHRYSLGLNRRRGRSGPVWQGRYKSRLVGDQRYFDRVVLYINLNPVTGGLVDDPADYRWSSHRELLGKVKQPLTDIEEALMGFGQTRRSARSAYVRSLRGAREESWTGETPNRLAWWVTDDDREIQPADSGPYVDVLGRSTGIDRPVLEPADYLSKAAKLLGVEPDDLADKGRQPEIVTQRELIAVLGVERYGVSVKALADLLGRRRVTVSTWVSRGAAKRSSSDSFREKVDELDRRIAEE